jgi:hypothetical protein
MKSTISGQEKEHFGNRELRVQPDKENEHLANHDAVSVARAQALYDYWFEKRTLPIERPPKSAPAHISSAFPGGGQDHCNKIYEDLLDLFIYAQHHEVEQGFVQVVFKKWQECDYPRSRQPSLPDLEIVDKAFQKLPSDHLILKHLVRLMGSLWRTDIMPFLHDYQPRGPGFERFLYGVCWHRYVLNLYSGAT